MTWVHRSKQFLLQAAPGHPLAPEHAGPGHGHQPHLTARRCGQPVGHAQLSDQRHDSKLMKEYLNVAQCDACCRLPLGIPSRLSMQALDMATSLIQQPGAVASPAAAACREAGYLDLGSVCWALPASALKVQLQQHCRTHR